MRDIVERLRAELAVACSERDALRERLHAVIEVYAGMEGFIPQTAPEGYLLRIIGQMKDAALAAKGQT